MSDPIIITDKDELKKAINKDDYTSQKLFGDNTPDKQCIDPWHIKIDTTGVDCDKEKATKSAPEEVIKQLPKQDNISTDVQNLKGILTDIAAGDPEAFKRPEFQCLNFDAIYAAIDWLIKTDQLSDLAKADLAENGWRLNFRARPPTPEEFLTEKYIGDQANTLYAPVRKSFIDAMDPLSPTRTVVLSPHIGWGKSLLAILINLYESVHFALMWHPYKFFGQSAATIYTQTFCAWSLKKGSELLLEPMEQILEQAPYFVRMRTHDEIVANAHDDEVADHICWTHATKSSALSMQNGVNYKLISDPGGLLGQTIMTGTMTELAFFTENGWTDEKILKFFTKLRQRIDSRMKGNYYGRFVLDSSPNNMESVIDKWIWEEAPKDPKNYIITGSRWKFFPEDFPYFFDENHNERHDFKNGFPLYAGGNGQPCQVLESQAQVDSHEQSDIIWCPVMQKTNNGLINFHDAAAENPIEFMRDWCGMPSGAADRIFYVPSIIDHVFNNNLKNVFSSIAAPKTEEPEHLIWNQVKDVFFHRIIDRYYFYYEPEIPRVASVDLAISGDTACISVSHVERDETKVDDNGDAVKVYVTDFTIPVTPKGGIINLDAFKFFIEDLRLIGNMNITHVSFDGFQSRSMMQALERDGITVDLLSVDKQNGPYLSFIDYVFHKRYYCGKSIMVKNNMLALQMTKRKETGTTKIDHKHGENVYTDQFATIGTTYNDNSWKYSQIGKFAKDTTDCIAGNISLLDTYANEYIPTHVFKAGDIYERSYENEKRKNELLMKNMGLSIQ